MYWGVSGTPDGGVEEPPMFLKRANRICGQMPVTRVKGERQGRRPGSSILRGRGAVGRVERPTGRSATVEDAQAWRVFS